MKLLPPPALAALLASSLCLAGCDSKSRSTHPAPPSLPTLPVRVQTAELKTHTPTQDIVATLRAKTQATLEAKVTGRIQSLPVALGQHLKTGDLVALLEAPEINARLAQAQATLAQAQNDSSRVTSLHARQAATQAELEAAQTRLRLAQAAVAEAEAILAYTSIHAPFPGAVAKKWAEVGDLASPGKPLLSIEDPSTLQLQADLPESLAANLLPGAQLRATVPGPHGELLATLSEIAPAADPATRTIRLRLDLPNHPGLASGQFARLHIPLGPRPSLRVPASALLRRGQMEIVFTVVEQRATLRLVASGQQIGDEVEILSGLRPGDTVILQPHATLVDGQPVQIQ